MFGGTWLSCERSRGEEDKKPNQGGGIGGDWAGSGGSAGETVDLERKRSLADIVGNRSLCRTAWVCGL